MKRIKPREIIRGGLISKNVPTGDCVCQTFYRPTHKLLNWPTRDSRLHNDDITKHAVKHTAVLLCFIGVSLPCLISLKITLLQSQMSAALFFCSCLV